MNEIAKEKKVLIVGSGFGGVACAKDLLNRHIPNLKVTLVNPTPHLEYRTTLYRVLVGRSPLEVCVPLREIFAKYPKKSVDLSDDTIIDIDFKKKIAYGKSESHYSYDYLVLAIGAETDYYDIAGLKDLAFSFGCIYDAIKLKKHLHEVFSQVMRVDIENNTCNAHFVIVGGGATGVEIAGELALYCKKIANKHGVDNSLITVDLISSATRLVPQLQSAMSEKIKSRLHDLGVNIYLGRRLAPEEISEIYIRDMMLRAKTLIWTTGMHANKLLEQIGLPVNKKGRAKVDAYLRPIGGIGKESDTDGKDFSQIFVIGDAAATPYAGLLKTAVYDGHFTADNIARMIYGSSFIEYKPKKPSYLIPVGQNWAAIDFHGLKIYGRLAWMLREFDVLRNFLSILPLEKAISAFRSDQVLWESCPICSKPLP